MLAGLMSFAISALLASLKSENAQDYVYACFFLISVRSLGHEWECTAGGAVPMSLVLNHKVVLDTGAEHIELTD